MSDFFDRVFNQSDDDDDKRAGLTAYDVADLPDEQRRVIVSFMRDAKETGGVLTLADLQDKHDDIDDLADVLDELTQKNWLTRLGEEPNIRYKLNFRRRRASRLTDDLWATLSDSAPETDDTDSDSPSDDSPSPDRPSFPSLSDW